MVPEQRTIMIVEDEPDAAEMFAEMMRLNGFGVIQLSSSRPAFDALAASRPDLLILDVMMPDISGLELLRFIRGDPGLASLPVIVVSAKALPADIKTGLEAGASIYLTKPVGYLDLKQAVDRFIRAEGDRPL